MFSAGKTLKSKTDIYKLPRRFRTTKKFAVLRKKEEIKIKQPYEWIRKPTTQILISKQKTKIQPTLPPVSEAQLFKVSKEAVKKIYTEKIKQEFSQIGKTTSILKPAQQLKYVQQLRPAQQLQPIQQLRPVQQLRPAQQLQPIQHP